MLQQNIRRVLLLVLVICLMASALSSCKMNKNAYTDYCFDYFDTVTSVTGFEHNKNDFDKVMKKIEDLLYEYHRLYDIYNTYDGLVNLAELNRLAAETDGPIEVDSRITELLSYGVEMYEKTDGNMNIAMGSVLSVWHDYRSSGIDNITTAELPSEEELLAAREHTDINKLVIDKEASTVRFLDPKLRLDVGALAKGYTVERIAEALEKEGISGYMLNVGGNVRAVGLKPGGEKWSVAIENPDTSNTEQPYIESLLIDNLSVVSSGSYQRYYIVNGKKYHHIIDKDTLYPATGYLSVSVVSPDSALSDALSTALFCMSIEEGRALVSTLENVYALWVCDNGEKVYSDGFSELCIGSR